MNRRRFLQTSASAAGLVAFSRNAWASAQTIQLQKWLTPIRGLGGAGIPVSPPQPHPVFGAAVDYHQIEAIEYTDQLHPQLLPTTLWGYKPVGNTTPRHLGGVI